MIKLVVYLGNPGVQYENTRHNVAWLWEKHQGNMETKTEKFKGYYYKTSNGVIHLLPKTFMNKSGESVLKCMQFFKISIDEVLVVHDDLETPFGAVKFKNGGGTAGHNGLKSISSQLGKGDYKRLAIGISRPLRGNVSSYVLQRFNPSEEVELPLIFDKLRNLFELYLKGEDKSKGKKITLLEL